LYGSVLLATTGTIALVVAEFTQLLKITFGALPLSLHAPDMWPALLITHFNLYKFTSAPAVQLECEFTSTGVGRNKRWILAGCEAIHCYRAHRLWFACHVV
jgi:hypothetical protein